MTKIDTSTWKEFRVGDIFECETTGGIASKNNLTEGNIPYITRSAENNGVSGTCGNIEKIVRGNCITIGAEGFTAFYQKNDFVAGNKVYTLRHPQMNEIIGLYLSSVLNVLSSKYSFADARILDKIKEEKVLLPVKKIDEIDFEYMEVYMKDIEKRVSVTLTALLEVRGKYNIINIKDWRTFKVGDLFEIYPTKSYKKINSALFNEDGKIPVIVNSAYNNGIGGYTNKLSTESGKIITFSDTTNADSIFYQDREFVGYSHVQGLHPIGEYAKMWKKESLQFFVTVFKSSAKNKNYDYANKFTRASASDLVVYLPCNSEGSPDFKYMEDFTVKNYKSVKSNFQKLMMLINKN